jgi:hypothetical protein
MTMQIEGATGTADDDNPVDLHKDWTRWWTIHSSGRVHASNEVRMDQLVVLFVLDASSTTKLAKGTSEWRGPD